MKHTGHIWHGNMEILDILKLVADSVERHDIAATYQHECSQILYQQAYWIARRILSPDHSDIQLEAPKPLFLLRSPYPSHAQQSEDKVCGILTHFSSLVIHSNSLFLIASRCRSFLRELKPTGDEGDTEQALALPFTHVNTQRICSLHTWLWVMITATATRFTLESLGNPLVYPVTSRLMELHHCCQSSPI